MNKLFAEKLRQHNERRIEAARYKFLKNQCIQDGCVGYTQVPAINEAFLIFCDTELDQLFYENGLEKTKKIIKEWPMDFIRYCAELSIDD